MQDKETSLIKRVGELQKECEALRRRVKYDEEKLKIQQLLIQDLSGELRKILQSARWKAVMKVVKSYDFVKRRHSGDTLYGHLERHLEEYRRRLDRLNRVIPLSGASELSESSPAEAMSELSRLSQEIAPQEIPVAPTLGDKRCLESNEESLYEAALERSVELPADLLEAFEKHPQEDTISVVTPTHNRAYSLKYCIESVLNQTYRNFELFVIDDASTDNTREMVEAYQKQDKRVTYMRKPKTNVSDTRNTALRVARGKYVAFLDSDNVWDRRFLQTMHYLLSNSDGGEKVAYCDCHLYEKGVEQDIPSMPWNAAQYRSRPFIDLCTVMADRDTVKRAGLFHAAMTKWVDYELLIRLNNLSGDFLHVPYALMSYFRLEDGLTLASSDKIPMRRNMERLWQSKLNGLKLAYVLNDFPALSQTFVVNEILYLRKMGFDVMVFYKIDPDESAEIPPDLPMYRFETLEQLENLIRKHRRNFMHSHFAYPMPPKYVLPAAEKTGVPFTFMPHAVDLFLQLNAERNEVARVTASPLCKAVFAIGTYHREYLTGRGCPTEKIVIARPFLDLSDFQTTSLRPIEQIKTIVSISRLQEKKGLADLIAAFKTLVDEDLSLRIYGFGPQEEELRRLSQDDSRIEFPGGLRGREQVKEALDRADLFVLPCIETARGDKDGLPTVLREAMAAGVPVVTTPISSIPDLVRDGETGFLARMGDPESLAATLEKIRRMPAAELLEIRTRAQKMVERSFDVDATIAPLLEVWKKN